MADDKVVHLPPQRADPRTPTEAELRARSADRLRALRESTGQSLEQWAAALRVILGPSINADLVAAWEEEDGPKPLLHWAVAAAGLAGQAADGIWSGFLLTQ